MSWVMSKDQQGLYWRLWGRACAVQGWHRLPSKEREGHRHEEHAKVFGCEKSAREINRTDEFGRIKSHFLALADDLQGAIETDRPDMDQGRRWRNKVDAQKQLLAALGLPPEAYVGTILKQVFRADSVEDLSANAAPGKRSPLERLLFTLAARIDAKRQEFGWSVHKLYSAASLPCPARCLQCANNAPADPF